MADEISGRRVLITGASRGIGLGCARRFASEGASLLLIARTEEVLREVQRELSNSAAAVEILAVDLTEPGRTREAVDQVISLFGGLDVLVCNAGAAEQGSFLELADSAWSAGFALKMFSAARLIRDAWHELTASRGHVVIMGGGTARTPERHLSLVSAVNGGLAALSKSIAEQGIVDGVHVNLVQPGMVRTSRRAKLFEKLAKHEGTPIEAFIQRTVAAARITRLGEPEDVANVVAFLASESSRWMQGAIVDVDGGQTKGV